MKQKIKKFLSIYRGIRLPWLLLILWLAVAVVEIRAEVVSVTISASIIDASRQAIKSDDLVKYILYLLLSGLLMIVSTWVSRMTEEKINLRVRVKLWDKIMRLPCRYYDADSGDELVSRVTSDTDAASTYFSMAISSISCIYAVVVIYKELFTYQADLAKWALLVIPVTLILGALYCILGYKSSFLVNSTLATSMGYLADRVRNFRLVKSFGMENEESKLGNIHYKKQFKAECLSNLNISIIQVAMQVIGCAFIIITFVAGGQLVAQGKITIGALTGFYTLSGVMGIKMSQVFMNMGAVAGATGGMKKIAEIFEAEEEPTSGDPVEEGQRDIRFENAAFAYNAEVPVLQGVSCVIPAGKVTAILGVNGCGKSTMLKLLSRMYEPDSGSIYYGERAIAEYDITAWRKKLAMVAQDNPLMSGTVRDNILYGVEREVTEEELIQVAKLTNVYDFVMEKPNGFDEEVGLGGGSFSGGQRQCLAMARAVLRDADYLLLDEVTSNLDPKSAQAVQSALSRVTKGRTAILIAHSYAATVLADHIVVLRDGKVEDAGTPKELLERNAFYQAFIDSAAET